MARVRLFMVLLLAIGMGGTFAFGTYRYMQNLPAQQQAKLPTTPVVVAAGNLDLGAALRPEDMRVIAWPADAVPPGSFRDPQQLVGRGVLQGMTQHEILLEHRLAPVE